MFIERHFSFSVAEHEGLWNMTFMSPFNREEPVSVYVAAPNSDYLPDDFRDKPIVNAGPRLKDVLNHLLYQIEQYPYSWDFSNKKIVTQGYDFETDYNGQSLTYIDLTEIAYKEINEYYNFFSPLEKGVVEEGATVSGKGVIFKLKITLDVPKNVNHLTVDFFTEYPIELLSFLYQGDINGQLYELPLSKAVTTNHSLILHFSTVYAKNFYLLFKQETYTLQSSSPTREETIYTDVWNQATRASQTLYESVVGDYLEWMMPTESGISLHQEIIDSYQDINKRIVSSSVDEMNSFGESFERVKKELDSDQR
jgi:hypothetical protein